MVIAVGAPPELAEAVSAVLALGDPVELVVVNSGGGDPVARLGALAPRVTIVHTDDLLFAGAARNRGIAASTAPFIAFLAADCLPRPGWISRRLVHHHAGHAAVATAVVGSHRANPFAWASHFALFGRRHPNLPDATALRYGASYDRRLFALYGPFREDLRIGEDTEFHTRLDRSDKPVWAPEIETVHRSPATPVGMLADSFRRGMRSGTHWPDLHRDPLRVRIHRRTAFLLATAGEAYPQPKRLLAWLGMPLVALTVATFELGVRKGRARATPLARAEAVAARAEADKNWKRALRHWRRAEALSPETLALSLRIVRCLRLLRRFEEAHALLDDLERRYPSLLAAVQERARLFEKRGDRALALEHWRAAARLRPASSATWVAGGEAALKLGDIDAARRAMVAARALAPSEKLPLRTLATLEARAGNTEQALAHYAELWAVHGDEQSLFDWLRLLLATGRIEPAQCLADSVERDGSETARLLARIVMAEARHDWTALVSALEALPPRRRNTVALLETAVNTYCILDRPADALAWIDSSEAGSEKLRKRLRLQALLRCGLRDEALPLLLATVEAGKAGELSSAYVTPLVVGAFDRGGVALARGIVASVAAATREQPALHLTLPFHRRRVAELAHLAHGDALPQTAPEAEVLALLGEVTDPALAPRLPEIAQAATTLSALRRQPRTVAPDPLYAFSDAVSIAGEIADAIDARRPLSLIRLGDGEGNFLPYRPALAALSTSDRPSTTFSWWGRRADGETAGTAISDLLQSAIANADIIGIPDLSRVVRLLVASPLDIATANSRNARGLVAAFEHVTAAPAHSASLTSCHVHEALDFWGLWQPLLRRAGTVSLVTCHPQLAPAVSTRFGVAVNAVHLIPAESKHRTLFGQVPAERHFPDVFDRLQEALTRTAPGAVVLVAAGMLGKVYCQRVRDAGGIALDIGSAADYWCGFRTRGLHETTAYAGPAGLPALYDRFAERDADFADLWSSAR